uniref:NADH-ubiquinone oxidoreductase chain 2 n=1 Tax=Rybaxis sp. 1 EF-2015 TaxID=1756864 RepID=A0A0S2M866_9COLE|nr:NADH deshydrogenase subunit 2 [Rybaxis sp. 1 EF-2015]
MFINSLIMSTFITISSNSWMGMWIGLEINMLSIIPLMNNIKNSYSSEASMKYFIVQAISSSILMLTMILMIKSMIFSFYMNMTLNLILNSSILTKMGAAPFHFWFPEIMEGLNWINCFIMMTWQKIAPMILLSYSMFNIQFLIMIIMFSMVIGGIMGLNQTNLRKILTYSSINHMSWMISSMLLMESIWFYYLVVYSLILSNLILILNKFNIFHMKQFFFLCSKNSLNLYLYSMNFLSMGGLPPFIGFFPKWLIIQNMINENFIFLAYLMIILTLITLFYYIRMMFSTLTLNINEVNFLKNKNNNNFLINLMNFMNIVSLPFCTLLFNFS